MIRLVMETTQNTRSLKMSEGRRLRIRILSSIGHVLLFGTASISIVAVLFIFLFIGKDAVPFFRLEGFTEFFTSLNWYPSKTTDAEFGAKAIFYGTGIVTLGAVAVAIPLGYISALCLSDILPFSARQWIKPVIEMLAAVPSVVYGFFALIVFAPLLQEQGGSLLAKAVWVVGIPVFGLGSLVTGDLTSARIPDRFRSVARAAVAILAMSVSCWFLMLWSRHFAGMPINSGTNAFNVSIILGIMALPTVVSVSEDALQAVGRDLREGSYALGATRAETLLKVILPAASSGLVAAGLLGVMRAIGETMVLWMASGNAAQIPDPWWNYMSPVRTLTATIAGDMGEADHVTGSSRYHVLFAMALCLLLSALICNLCSEALLRRQRIKWGS
jgi:phosphate transport system permease protein